MKAVSKQLIEAVASNYNFTVQFENDAAIHKDGFFYFIYNNGQLVHTGATKRQSPSSLSGTEERNLNYLNFVLAKIANTEPKSYTAKGKAIYAAHNLAYKESLNTDSKKAQAIQQQIDALMFQYKSILNK